MAHGNASAKAYTKHRPTHEADETDSEVEMDETDVMDETIEKQFRKGVNGLFKYLCLISKAWEEREKSKEGIEKAIARTRKIESVAEAVKEMDTHLVAFPFVRLLNANYNSIRQGPSFDAWLREINNKEVILSFPNTRNKKAKPLKVGLSSLYLDAHEIAYHAQLAINAVKNEDEADDMCSQIEQLVYPQCIRLYLWRIFAALATKHKGKEAGARVRSSIETLEMDLGIAKGGDVLRRAMRLVLEDDESPILNMIEWGSEMIKSFVPGSMHKAFEEFVELLKRYANKEIEFDEMLQSVVDSFSDATGLRKHVQGEKIVGDLRETVASTLGELAKKDGKTMGPVEMFQKMAQVFNAAKKSKLIKAKMETFQKKFGNVKSMEDAKKINPITLLKFIEEEATNEEFIKELESIMGQKLDNNDVISSVKRIVNVAEAIMAALSSESNPGEESAQRVRSITDGSIVGEEAE